MSKPHRDFPELVPWAPLSAFWYLFADGTMTHNFRRAVAARRAGQYVRCSPRTGAAVHLVDRSKEPPATAPGVPPPIV